MLISNINIHDFLKNHKLKQHLIISSRADSAFTYNVNNQFHHNLTSFAQPTFYLGFEAAMLALDQQSLKLHVNLAKSFKQTNKKKYIQRRNTMKTKDLYR